MSNSSRVDFISKKVSELADKYKISDEQAIQILYDSKFYNEVWGIVGLDEYLLDVAHKFNIKL